MIPKSTMIFLISIMNNTSPMGQITWSEFEMIELRSGTIIEVRDFPEARKPAYKIKADF